ncbi:hypothetical protein B0H13DRAFT_1591831 [Mycena leptocephala]|nr:hypothetical protein B0H13DRAFT_1591831 [Mycena leptocephala]
MYASIDQRSRKTIVRRQTAGAHPQMVMAVRGLIDFAYFASLQSHTSTTLDTMQNSLNTFHANKQIFIDLKGRKKDFNIPKIHSLDHYVPLIRLFGTPDGFNTESPERLHIDYAKNAYRASNRKDYIDQMTVWLQRQESVARFSAYLEWAHPTLPQTTAVATTPVFPTSTPLTALTPTPTAAANSNSNPESSAIEKDSLGHNASRFILALTTFFGSSTSTSRFHFQPRTFDMFGTWKRISFRHSKIPEVGERHSTNLVRATAPAPASLEQRRAAEPAHLDFALIRTGEQNSFTAGTALAGLRVAQVKVIFQVPAHYPGKSGPLAYIEWFTPLRSPDSLDGYYHLTRSSRQHGPYAEIITLDRIVRNVMLIPQKWSQDKSFLNSHSDRHAFCLYKPGYDDSLPK